MERKELNINELRVTDAIRLKKDADRFSSESRSLLPTLYQTMRIAAEREFLSCDWGTSHFRLKWVDHGKVIADFCDENGCKKLSQAAGASSTRGPAEVFEHHLQAALNQLVPPNTVRPIPLLISGMASSTIGWMELPYATAPIHLDGSNLRTHLVSWNHPSFVAETYLISGLATDCEIMRGEETEAIGLLSLVPNLPDELVLILPGTHSKHLHLSKGVLRTFRTYMTGELYAVLSQHSVLAASVDSSAAFDPGGFLSGLRTIKEQGFPASLFQTRTRQVLKHRSPGENASFLSGLLIGAELENLIRSKPPDIFLGGAPRLRDLYGKALSHLNVPVSRTFSDTECTDAVPRGHEIILSRLSP